MAPSNKRTLHFDLSKDCVQDLAYFVIINLPKLPTNHLQENFK